MQVSLIPDHGGGGLVTKSCPTLVTPWTVACQAPLSMGFASQEYWSCHFLLQGILVFCITGRFFANYVEHTINAPPLSNYRHRL